MVNYLKDTIICLDKTSHKAICPRCGRKTFVNYLYADGTPVADGHCGRCDRRDKCGYHLPPRTYFGQRMEAVQARPLRPYEPVKPGFISHDDMVPTLEHYDRNHLAVFLHSVFDPYVDASDIDALLYGYGVGTARGGKTIYWQIDPRGGIRTGKVMAYDAASGKRTKEPGSMSWAHSLLKDRYPDFLLEQAYFGSHLANVCGDAFQPRIWLFESEKAALIAALYLRWGGTERVFVPMASGGCENFNPTADALRNPYHRLQVLKGRRVTLFPDEGKYDEWSGKAERLRGFCAEIEVSTVMERLRHPLRIECDINPGDGFDDIIMRYIASGRIDQIISLL